MGITIKGEKSLKKKFDHLATVAQGKNLERALVAGALLTQNEAKRNVPVLTGNLRRSIHIGGHDDLNPGGADVTDRSGAGVPEPEIGAHSAAVYVGTDVEYADDVEFGAGNRAPQPYLRPAFDSTRDEAKKEIGAALRELIKAAI